jgi:asparagine synthase (glutamine-hydrolysing)
MCGITGFFNASGAGGDEELRRIAGVMVETLRHRGPDADGIWTDARAGLALGHSRLSIRDLSPAGAQPMVSGNGRYVIVYNGELYNAEAVADELAAAGIVFRGHSDTEVLVEACAAWGIAAALRRVNGMYAFALWDGAERRLHLARDPVGIKPLYWMQRAGALVFGSELKAIRAHPAFSGAIDPDAVVSLLRHNYVKGPGSIYAGVAKLPPGHLLSIGADGEFALTEIRSSIDMMLAGKEDSGESDIDEIERVLADAVRRQMVADVGLGAFLSGGIDSSLVVALAQQASGRPVSTFTIGFDEAGYDEAREAAKIARHLGTDHHELYVDGQQCLEVVPDLAGIFDEPFADISQIPTILLSRMTRRSVTVALSGDGGDELFAGYDRYFWALRLLRLNRRVPLPLRRGAGCLLRAIPARWWNRLMPGGADGGENRAGDRMHRLGDLIAQPTPVALYRGLLAQWSRPLTGVATGAERESYVASSELWRRADSPLDYMRAHDMMTYLPDDILTKVDRASMSTGLEARVPFLDDQVIEAAARLPDRFKAGPDGGKLVLRDLLCRYLPADLVDRPKHGFSVPIGAWLRGPLRDWAEDLLSARKLNNHGLLNTRAVRSLWAEHLAGTGNHQYQLWSPLMLQAWLDADASRG